MIKKYYLVILLVMVIVFSSTVNAVTIPCTYLNPSHAFMFDTGNVSLDCIDGRNLTTNTNWNTSYGKYDAAIYLNYAGTDYAPPDVGELGTNFTISFWYKGNSSNCGAGTFISKSDGSAPSRYNMQSNAQDVINFNGLQIDDACNTSWNMLTLRRTQTNLTIFINAMFVNSTTDSTVYNGNSLNFYLGKTVGTLQPFTVNVTMDDLRIWENTSLTDSNITTLYNYAFTNTTITDLYSQNQVNNSIEGQYLNFTLEFLNSSLVHTNTTAWLIYNGSQYPATDSGITFLSSIAMPSINNANSSNFNYYWGYNLTYFNGTIAYGNTTTLSNTVFRIKITDDCAVLSTTKTINFTMRDEISDVLLNGNWEIAFNTYFTNTSLLRYDSFTYSARNSSLFCISPSFAQYTSEINIIYSATGYGQRNWYKAAYGLNSSMTTQNLYLLSSTNTTSVTIHLTDESDIEIANIVVELERWDLPLNSYSLVETETTNSEGEAVFNIESGVEYRFKFYQDGILVKTTDKAKITSADLYFRLTDSTSTQLQRLLEVRTVTNNLTFNYDTNILSFGWNDVNNYVTQVCVNLTSTNGTNYIFSQCSTAESGTITYQLTVLNISYYAYSYAYHEDGGVFSLRTVSIEPRKLWEEIGEDSPIFAYMILVLFGMIGLANATVGIVLLTVGFFIIWALELMYINTNVFMAIVFTGVVMIIIKAVKER